MIEDDLRAHVVNLVAALAWGTAHGGGHRWATRCRAEQEC